MDITGTSRINLETGRFDAAQWERLRPQEEGADFAARLLKADAKADEPALDAKLDKKLYEQCEQLETFFLKTLISGMRKTIERSELTKPGFAGEMYEDMLWDEYAKDFSKNAGFGFAKMAYLTLTNQRGTMLNQKI